MIKEFIKKGEGIKLLFQTGIGEGTILRPDDH